MAENPTPTPTPTPAGNPGVHGQGLPEHRHPHPGLGSAPDPEGGHDAHGGRDRPTAPSVWIVGQRASRFQRQGRYTSESFRHPGKMMPALAAHAITRYTEPGELVFDPMCGIGTTLVEAVHLGRHAVGVEYEANWARIARDNLALAASQGATGTGQVVTGDARALPDLLDAVELAVRGRVALVLTSPPYGPSTHGMVRSSRDSGQPGVQKRDFRYSARRDPANLAHTSTANLLSSFGAILAGCRPLMRPGGILVVTTRPWRVCGELVDLPSAVIAAGQAAGFEPLERCPAALAALRGDRLVPRASFFQNLAVRQARAAGTPLHAVIHEDVVVFRVPRPPTQAAAVSSPPPPSVPPAARPHPCHAGAPTDPRSRALTSTPSSTPTRTDPRKAAA